MHLFGLSVGFGDIVVLAAFLGIAVSNFFSGRAGTEQKTSDAQRNAIEAQRAQLDAVAQTVHEKELTIASLKAELAGSRQLQQKLEEMVKGVPDWGLLHASMTVLEKSVGEIVRAARSAGDWTEPAKLHYQATEELLKLMKEAKA